MCLSAPGGLLFFFLGEPCTTINRKADMLRYLVLLAAGGVYSDADTRALMPLAH